MRKSRGRTKSRKSRSRRRLSRYRASDNVFNTKLLSAAQLGRKDLITLYIKNFNADVNHSNTNKVTALMFAAREGHDEVVRTLLELNADPNLQEGQYKSTALMSAAKGGHDEVVNTLLDLKANPDLQTQDKSTALMFAAKEGHENVVKTLLRGTVDPNLKNNDGKTALMFAASKGSTQIVIALLDAKADPNLRDNKSRDAWIRAAGHDTVRTILETKQQTDNLNDAIIGLNKYISKYGLSPNLALVKVCMKDVEDFIEHKALVKDIHKNVIGSLMIIAVRGYSQAANEDLKNLQTLIASLQQRSPLAEVRDNPRGL